MYYTELSHSLLFNTLCGVSGCELVFVMFSAASCVAACVFSLCTESSCSRTAKHSFASCLI